MRPFVANARFAAHDAHRLAEALSVLPNAGPDLLIALDIDGTTVKHDTSLSPRVAEAIAAHRAAGTRVIMSTGRGIAGALLVTDQLGIDAGEIVCSNGAIIVERDASVSEAGIPDGVRLTHVDTFDPSPIIEVIADALPEVLLAVEPARGPRRMLRPFPDGELQGESVLVPLAELGGTDATRLTVRAPDMTADDLVARIEPLGLTGVEYAIGWTAWMDFSPPSVSKASALEKIRALHGISPAGTIAAGDGANDIEMIRWAKVGVAMGGVSQRVIDAADALTAPVDDDGLALVLENLLY